MGQLLCISGERIHDGNHIIEHLIFPLCQLKNAVKRHIWSAWYIGSVALMRKTEVEAFNILIMQMDYFSVTSSCEYA